VRPEAILHAREVVHGIYVDPKIKEYVLDLVFATREPEQSGIPELLPLIAYGASPRASIYLISAAKAHAVLQRRGYVTPEDIKQVAMDILRHRIIVTYEAEAEEVTSADIVRAILNHVEVP
jgi:MoxR-like ATPase